jgi:tetratricopeptide (TPR) repeat protein
LQAIPEATGLTGGKALSYYIKKEYEKSITLFEKRNELCPEEEVKQTNFYLSNSYIMLGDYNGAINEILLDN